jgi:hypothetical protein
MSSRTIVRDLYTEKSLTCLCIDFFASLKREVLPRTSVEMTPYQVLISNGLLKLIGNYLHLTFALFFSFEG